MRGKSRWGREGGREGGIRISENQITNYTHHVIFDMPLHAKLVHSSYRIYIIIIYSC